SKVSWSWSASCSRIELNSVTVSPSKLPYSAKAEQSVSSASAPASGAAAPPPIPPPRSSAPPQAARSRASVAVAALSTPARRLRVVIDLLHRHRSGHVSPIKRRSGVSVGVSGTDVDNDPVTRRRSAAEQGVQHRDDAVVVHRPGDEVSRRAGLLVGPLHGHPEGGPPEHLDVVAAVAHRDGRRARGAGALTEHLQCAGLRDALGGDVEPGGPADGVGDTVQPDPV